MTKVLIGWNADDYELNYVRRELPDVELDFIPPHKTISRVDCDWRKMADRTADIDVLLTWTIGPEVYKTINKLRLLAWQHSGFDPINIAALRAKGVALTNVAGANATAVAEQAFMFMMALAKRVVERDRRVKAGNWIPLWEPATSSVLLEGSTVAIVGFGAIGERVARRARAFDMKVIGVRRSGQPHPDADEMYTPADMDKAVATADFVVMAAPHTPETHEFFSEREMAAMKRGAYLLNVGRGRVIDELALKAALDSGHIEGFASDVWWSYTTTIPEGWHYSTSSRMGIHLRDNVIASHDSSCDIMSVNRQMFRQAVLNVKEFLAGRTPPNLVFDGKELVGSLVGLESSQT